MASTQTNFDLASTPAVGTSGLLISLVPLPQDAFEATLSNLALAFPGESVFVATPDTAPQSSSGSPLRLVPYTPTTISATPSGPYRHRLSQRLQTRAGKPRHGLRPPWCRIPVPTPRSHPRSRKVRSSIRPHPRPLRPWPTRRPRQLRHPLPCHARPFQHAPSLPSRH